MKYKKNIISNLIFHILSLVIGFASSILIARRLGPELQGNLSYYVLIFGLVAAYGHLGITSSTSYFMKKSKYSEETVINNNLTLMLLLSAFFTIILVLFRNSIFSSNVWLLMLIWLIYTISSFLSNYFMNIYMADENVYIYNRYLNISYVLKLIVVIFLYFSNHLSILTISILYGALELFKLLMMIKGLKFKYKFEINKELVKEEFKYGIPLYLAALFIYLNYRADQLMVKGYLGDAELGIYALAVTLAELAKMIPDSFVSAFTGKLYGTSVDEKKGIVSLTVKLSFYLTLLVCVVGVLCKPLIGVMYGEEYLGAGLPMIILLLGIPFLSVGKVTSVYYYTDGKSKIHMYVSLIVLIINLILNIIFIPLWGITGAAFTSSLSYLAYAIIYLVLLKQSGFSLKDMLIVKRDDVVKVKTVMLSRRKKVKVD